MKPSVAAQKFDVGGRLVSVETTGDGNVNDTYLAVFRTPYSEERVILQRINAKVFPRPEAIMENMRAVTEHVHARFEAEADAADRIWQLPRVIRARDGRDFIVDDQGNYWRSMSLIASAQSFSCVQSLDHAHEAGLVLGQFQRVVSDVPLEGLHDTLEGFHVTPGYVAHLDAALSTPEGRTRLESSPEAKACDRFISERRDWCSVLEDARERGELVDRIIHGDPKISNIMIDNQSGKGISIVDLDTVKPGLIHYDFGDCLRSCCNPAGEEVKDLAEVRFDLELCAAIVRGYRVHAEAFLTEADREYLFDSVRLIAFELGLRFFADFIAGDLYFKTHYKEHNLRRAQVQLKLVEGIEAQESAIRKALRS